MDFVEHKDDIGIKVYSEKFGYCEYLLKTNNKRNNIRFEISSKQDISSILSESGVSALDLSFNEFEGLRRLFNQFHDELMTRA